MRLRRGPAAALCAAVVAALVWTYTLAGWPLVLGAVAVWLLIAIGPSRFIMRGLR